MHITRRQLKFLINEAVINEEDLFGIDIDGLIDLAKDYAIPDELANSYNTYREELINQAVLAAEAQVEQLVLDSLDSAFASIDLEAMMPPEYKNEYTERLAKEANDYVHDMGKDTNVIAQEIADCAKKVVARHLRAKLNTMFPKMPSSL